ncbi:TetR family transcriptional regulator [Microtetraspora sp. NBRC 13810]|uniref:TetR/AcrR family transcriptional regulator n=1 Tax=Microtetraspora sp. NBRC 13810 TaxID=3030990 RepID=UPI0024A41F27|nr:TetR/AcrR family transcriptional regulator [Microtetraspora sp. NBRC 13810]GLW05693.1 TetR family transcriptional regulator [Microtetraspora sp. NBRC 13810]
MAGRPRTISEERIMVALAATVGRVGPSRLTLADVAREAGVSTGVLVGRYGSKRDLLLGFVRWGLSEQAFARPMRAAFETAADPVEGLIRAVVRSAGPGTEPGEFANHLAFLHLELADEEFRALLGEHDAAVRAELAGYLRAAVTAGRLVPGADVEALASAVDSIRNGTQITWAMTRSQPLGDAIRRDLTTLLAPYRSTEEDR